MPRLDLGEGRVRTMRPWWDGYGHFLRQEAPDRFAAAMRAWLDRLPAAQPAR
jgi:hypothetical protein